MHFQTIDILKEASERWPDKTAVFQSGTSTSFSELHHQTNSLTILLNDFLEKKGRGIGLLCGNNINFLTGLFASSKVGFVVMPIWKGLHSSEIEAALVVASINLILVEKDFRSDFQQKFERRSLNTNFDLIHFPEIFSESITDKFPNAAFIRPSSGTTGQSKGVVISHQAVLERIDAANQSLNVKNNDNVLWVLPMAFHFIVSVILYIRYGASIIITEDFLPESIIQLANKNKASLLYAGPLHYRLLSTMQGNERFNTLKKAISTSASIDQSIVNKFHDKFDILIQQAFGIIEIGLPLVNTSTDVDKSSSVGIASHAYKIKIFTEDMKPAGENQPGLLAIKGPGMFSGYLWPCRKAEDVFHESWFLTGDIATIDKDGFVSIIGRSKSVINVSGNKVFPEEIENILKLHPDVSDAFVFRTNHALTGEIPEAEVVRRVGSDLTSDELISFCKKHLSAIKIPHKIFLVSEIAKTKTGKTLRL
ncbi:MAG: acyl--CoA ligase [Bacteroidia bacterium]|nr:acyl--CoA ligase [Bacteroidia bacterium]